MYSARTVDIIRTWPPCGAAKHISVQCPDLQGPQRSGYGAFPFGRGIAHACESPCPAQALLTSGAQEVSADNVVCGLTQEGS